MNETSRTVAILLFPEVEVLDFAGPFEVFSVSGRASETSKPFKVFTVADSSPVIARNGLKVIPDFSPIEQAPACDILVVPGGWGTRREMSNQRLLNWIAARASSCELVLSVCTGALLLARAGLLENLSATTHRGAIGLLKELAPSTTVREEVRFVDNGTVISAAGVAAGIDMCLHVVERLCGKAMAQETADYIEYPWISGTERMVQR